jgi:hypothetical protein
LETNGIRLEFLTEGLIQETLRMKPVDQFFARPVRDEDIAPKSIDKFEVLRECFELGFGAQVQ